MRMGYMMRLGVFAFLGAFLAIFGLASGVRAEIAILSSEIAGLEPGEVIADNTKLVVPAGKTLRIMLPSGRTQTIEGPYTGPAGTLAKGEKRQKSLWTAVIEFLTNGGRSRNEFGGVRSAASDPQLASDPQRPPLPFSWHVVPLGITGNVCVENGAKLFVGRSDPARKEKATLIDKATDTRATLLWPAGVSVVRWPASLAPGENTSFTILAMNQPSRDVTLQPVPAPLPGDGRILQVLWEHGCEQQIEAWLRDKRGPNRHSARK